MIQKYVTKTVTIEAIKWDGGNKTFNEIQEEYGSDQVRLREGVLEIKTLEGVMTAAPGDYIIRGLKDEIYPCKPDVFTMKYQPV